MCEVNAHLFKEKHGIIKICLHACATIVCLHSGKLCRQSIEYFNISACACMHACVEEEADKWEERVVCERLTGF